MLIVLNGAQKGGSTWLVQIARAIVKAERVPAEYQEPSYRNSSLAWDKLDAFLSEVDWRRQTMWVKQHWTARKQALQLATDPDTRFVNIIRDIRDVLVSRYHHDTRLGLATGGQQSFQDYYMGQGRDRMAHYCGYQFFWHRDAAPRSQPLLLSYEGLKQDFRGEVTKMGLYLGSTPAMIDYAAAAAKSDVSTKTAADGFFRKGIVGDWRNHFTPEVAAAFERQMEELGYLDFVRSLDVVSPESLTGGSWADQLA